MIEMEMKGMFCLNKSKVTEEIKAADPIVESYGQHSYVKNFSESLKMLQ
jgi:hypothetical protein